MRPHAKGFSLVEVLISLMFGALILTGAGRMLSLANQQRAETHALSRQIDNLTFVMERLSRHGRNASRLILPLIDRPASPVDESVRPLLAVTLPASVDRNGDGFADADNDRDGRIDEDTPGDMTNDGVPGVYLIDDDGDGATDEGFSNRDDDEYLSFPDEDPLDGVDSDNDGTRDEDWGDDANNDGQPGIAGVDDDGDGQIDEGSRDDDDEDGQSGEDWLDPVVYYLTGTDLIERLPVPWDADGDAQLDGRDFVESVVLEDVSLFRVERVDDGRVNPLVEVSIETTVNGTTRSLTGRFIVGALP